MFRQFVAIALAACLLAFAVTARAEAIKLAVTDLVGLEELQREFGAFKAELEKVTGSKVEFLPVTNRTAALEALRFKKVDFVLTGPAEYVVMKKRANADVVVGLSRPNYFSMIVVMADSPYFSLKELKGKKIGMGSVGSTSRHLGPAHILAEAGVDPLKDVQVIHTNVRLAWESLKKSDVDAVGMGRSDYEGLLAKEAETKGLQPSAFRVLARSPDLPNDLLIAAAHVDPAMVEKMRKAFSEHSDALIAAIMVGEQNKKYHGMRFLTQIGDKDYDVVRVMFKTAGYPEYSQFIGE